MPGESQLTIPGLGIVVVRCCDIGIDLYLSPLCDVSVL